MPRFLFHFAILSAALACNEFGSKAAQACDHCAEESPCRKVCRLVYEPKKIEITCWGCKCEEFCVPGPSKVRCKHCETVCDFCDTEPNSDVDSGPKKFVWREWLPGSSAKVFTRKKLMKRTVTKTVPSYKWVVEDLCEKCEMNLPEVKVEPGVSVPPPPPVPAAK